MLRAGFIESSQPQSADLIIVNTCGFIQPARQESLQVLREFASSKRKGQFLIAAGCLSEREKQHLAREVQGLDGLMSTRRWADIVEVVERIQRSPSLRQDYFPETEYILESDQRIVRAAVQGRSAYLKIADGCDRHCAFCAIPLIKGRMCSRPLEHILEDARALQSLGIQELILIAQDTTVYGSDLGMQDGLVRLLRNLLQSVPAIPWIRIMYTFPGMISQDLIGLLAADNQILPYLDIPLQHAHPQVLRRMHRPADMRVVFDTIEKIRSANPRTALRSTFIIGFPGETHAEFETLLDFIQDVQFDHVGFFPYSHEQGTSASALEDDVPADLKQERLQHIAQLQEEISLSRNKTWVGERLQVLVEGSGDGISVGRCFRDAPEIDGLVLLDEILPSGSMITAEVSGALTHDLLAKRQKQEGG